MAPVRASLQLNQPASVCSRAVVGRSWTAWAAGI